MSFIVIYLGGLPLYFEVYTTKLFCSSHHFKIGAKKVVKMACLYNYYGNFATKEVPIYFKILVVWLLFPKYKKEPLSVT